MLKLKFSSCSFVLLTIYRSFAYVLPSGWRRGLVVIEQTAMKAKHNIFLFNSGRKSINFRMVFLAALHVIISIRRVHQRSRLYV
jgi:hypothetical protein